MSVMRVIIVGTGGLGREVQEVIEDINRYSEKFAIEGFLDSNIALHGTTVNGISVLGDLPYAETATGHGYIVAVGNPVIRANIIDRLRSLGVSQFPNVMHPEARISFRASIGEGSIIRSGASIQTGAHLGNFCSLSQYAVIGHDCIIGNYLSIAPHACIVGGVKMGNGVNVGTGASVVFPATVADWSTIGAGAVVTKHVTEGSTVVGVPAHPIRS